MLELLNKEEYLKVEELCVNFNKSKEEIMENSLFFAPYLNYAEILKRPLYNIPKVFFDKKSYEMKLSEKGQIKDLPNDYELSIISIFMYKSSLSYIGKYMETNYSEIENSSEIVKNDINLIFTRGSKIDTLPKLNFLVFGLLKMDNEYKLIRVKLNPYMFEDKASLYNFIDNKANISFNIYIDDLEVIQKVKYSMKNENNIDKALETKYLEQVNTFKSYQVWELFYKNQERLI